LRSWEVESGGEKYTIRLAVHHDGIEEDIDRYAEKARKIVAEHAKIYGELPPFDYGTYTFIADYLPYDAGDGMEHRNSTILTSSHSLLESNFAQLGTLSHEFFHAWNVERIRPVDLEPFDFERANMSENLWFAEGFTSYYGDLVMRRAGEMSDAEFADSLTYYVNTVTNSPGRNFASPQGMSRQAPFVDAASAIDPTNFQNIFISYYTYGAAIAVALDLEIRARFEGRSLDSLMRHMWQTHGKPGIPYTNADLRKALAEVTGDQRFANDFFDRFIEASELPDYAELLANAGFRLQLSNPGRFPTAAREPRPGDRRSRQFRLRGKGRADRRQYDHRDPVVRGGPRSGRRSAVRGPVVD
jgi:predicted metalloprotease with PDZ domain